MNNSPATRRTDTLTLEITAAMPHVKGVTVVATKTEPTSRASAAILLPNLKHNAPPVVLTLTAHAAGHYPYVLRQTAVDLEALAECLLVAARRLRAEADL